MSHKEHKVGGMISRDVDDERRLYECVKKYQTIVKQVDELMGMMNNMAIVTKGRKNRKGSASGARASVSSGQHNNNEALVKTVTRFLHELGASPTDSEC
ncbi:hypothetical protein RIF29_20350 [Crotalaria pallida]|uniref:Uncharacterized protein n=1 Tax=Crotalaria pallida TaxID=3830 RepID=A0AAN9F1F0_CROPI